MQSNSSTTMGAWIATGTAIGVAIGLMMDNVAMGIPIGLALGVALGIANMRRESSTQSPDTPGDNV